MRNKIIPYKLYVKEYARELRKNSTLSEVILRQNIKRKGYEIQFHRQVPMLDHIVDFYCHELMLAIEIDGDSHLYKYEYDKNRQVELEKQGVTFIRFNDIDVKQNLFSVLLSLETEIERLQTPLKSPQGDNPTNKLFS